MTQVIIIGAGLAGLTCAKVLQASGICNVIVIDQSDAVGGRVRTDFVEGFYLDRGFQVLFTAYPMVQKYLNLPALDLCYYRPGAVLVQQGRSYLVGDPFRDIQSLIPSLRNPLITTWDKFQTLRLRWGLGFKTWEQILQTDECSTLDFMKQFGFTDRMIKAFLQPFYRGILLDPDLNTTAQLFQFYFKMLSEGSIVTPRLGLGQISEQLAASLKPDQVRLNTKAVEILTEDERVIGIRTQAGDCLQADQWVWATDAPSVPQMLQLKVPAQARSVTCLYFYSSQSLTRGAYLHLNAMDKGLINNVTELTQVSPDLAPSGLHLYAVVVLGTPPLSPPDLVQQIRGELQQWFPLLEPDQLSFLRSYTIPFAQFDQPVGGYQQRSQIRSPLKNLTLAGEYLHQSSIEGAMRSGEQAALAILQQ